MSEEWVDILLYYIIFVMCFLLGWFARKTYDLEKIIKKRKTEERQSRLINYWRNKDEK